MCACMFKSIDKARFSWDNYRRFIPNEKQIGSVGYCHSSTITKDTEHNSKFFLTVPY